ncbi:hypothetical protein PK28_00395 [Hymenobacter sp. DG25B]|uniref:DUF6799 domain-containing protein n=1 Tax=Hymenobacter sp. DG25B TaxID=1385664 RepID=UPI0005408958|nr:DUF6799 domain-containing protein [Hymenobacter sp. DG25B]AIZ62534.1 hypothetical protein PK28_00395 [Hymenobacter sp. DG25B]
MILVRFCLFACLWLSFLVSHAQSSNDGFVRRDGTMYVVRNGAQRPMTQDVHLPNGRTVSRDGFIVETDGRHTELAEGQGCTLLGAVVAVHAGSNGQLTLASPARPSSATRRVSAGSGGGQRWEGPRGKAKGHKKKGKHKGWKFLFDD